MCSQDYPKRGRCEILPCRTGPCFGSSAQLGDCIQGPEARKTSASAKSLLIKKKKPILFVVL